MKRTIYLVLAIALVIGINACSKDSDGNWSDNIKLSVKQADFSASGDSISITTEGDWWWVTEVRVDSAEYYNFENVDLESDNYTLQDDCFVVERRGKNSLFIKVDENTSEQTRTVIVELEAGDYFDRVTINQASK